MQDGRLRRVECAHLEKVLGQVRFEEAIFSAPYFERREKAFQNTSSVRRRLCRKRPASFIVYVKASEEPNEIAVAK